MAQIVEITMYARDEQLGCEPAQGLACSEVGQPARIKRWRILTLIAHGRR